MNSKAIVFLLVIFISSSLVAEEYSESKIKQNVGKYINDVFGQHPPKFIDYIKYETSHGSMEYTYIDELCVKKWGVRGKKAKECNELHKERWDKRKTVESLYYSAVREKLGIMPISYKMDSIKMVKGGSYIVELKLNNSGYSSMIIKHSSKYLYDIGIGAVTIVELKK